tara:strand:- start:512 stop:1264 length:753 start_codon:yes stop_codon:yes gene_type:complete
MKYLVFGDSHTIFFNITPAMRLLDSNLVGVQSVVKTIGGSTISGFGKRNSTLNTLAEYRKAYLEEKPDFIVFALGQVDLELGYYYRWFVKHQRPDDYFFVESLIDGLLEEVENIVDRYGLSPGQVVIKGVNLSVLTYDRRMAIRYVGGIVTENLTDKCAVDEAKKRILELFPSNLERNNVHLLFNSLLRERAHLCGFKYFDINDEIVDAGTSKVALRFISAKFDHHIVDSLEVRLIHVKKLLETLYFGFK